MQEAGIQNHPNRRKRHSILVSYHVDYKASSSSQIQISQNIVHDEKHCIWNTKADSHARNYPFLANQQTD